MIKFEGLTGSGAFFVCSPSILPAVDNRPCTRVEYHLPDRASERHR